MNGFVGPFIAPNYNPKFTAKKNETAKKADQKKGGINTISKELGTYHFEIIHRGETLKASIPGIVIKSDGGI